MAKKVQRSVFIGLGGTGQSAVLNVKKKLIEVYGEVPTPISFLVLDTDAIGSTTDYRGNTVSLTGGEYKHMELKAPGKVIENPEVAPWWPRSIKARMLGKGAGGVRAYGRLGLFVHGKDIYDKIHEAYKSVKTWSIDQDSVYQPVDSSVMVHIIASIAGGTGAGTFLDVAMILKSAGITDNSDYVFGHLLMPDVFTPLKGVYNAERNAYACAQELDMLMGMEQSQNFDYRLGGRTIDVSRPPFNAIYLINNKNASGTVFTDVSELTEFIGANCYLTTGELGRAQASAADNIMEKMSEADPWEGRDLNYASYGLAELFFDRDRYVDLHAATLAKNVVTALFAEGEEATSTQSARQFLEANGLVEDVSDQVIDRILLPGDFLAARPPVGSAATADALRGLLSSRATKISQVMADTDTRAQPNTATIQAEAIKALGDQIDHFLSTPGGFRQARAFLQELAGIVKATQDILRSERQSLADQVAAIGPRYTALDAEIGAAAKALIGGARRREEVGRSIAKAINDETILGLEIRRRELAIGVFSALSIEIERTQSAFKNLSEIARHLSESLAQKVETLRHPRLEAKPFVVPLESDALRDKEIPGSSESFLIHLRDEVQVPFVVLGEYSQSQLIELMLRYANSQPAVNETRALTIDDVVGQLPAAEQEQYYARLIEVSAPQWSFDDGYVSGDRKATMVTNRVIGFPTDRPTFSDAVRSSGGGSTTDTAVASGDPLRVYISAVQLALPAFVINNFKNYQERYIELPDDRSREKYHANRTWIKDLPELIPAVRSSRSEMWAIANALAEVKRDDEFKFGAVIKNANTYSFISRSSGQRIEGYRVKLGSGRLAAYEAFMDNTDFLGEVEESISAETERRGVEAVAASVRQYLADLKAMALPKDKTIVQMLNAEMEDLEQFLQDLVTVR